MMYRNFGNLSWRPSALGFGCMRLPRLADGSGKIDEDESTRLIRHAIDEGVNYIDTAYAYAGSEVAVGKALAGGYRERVKLATKLPVWDVADASDADRILSEQLAALQTDHIDFYLLHALNERLWPLVQRLQLIEWAERQIAAGRIGHLGFSFHGGPEMFKSIIDYYSGWTFCMIQYNYLDANHQAGMTGLRYAHQRGLGVVIMEPLRGGLLANANAPEVKALLAGAPTRRSAAEWSLQWLWNQPEVSVVLSGMNSLGQLDDNLGAANRSGVDSLRPSELEFVGELGDAYRRRMVIPCTYCGYCLTSCPQDVNITEQFEIYNNLCAGQDRARFERVAALFSGAPQRGFLSNCLQCGACEQKCPQKLPIREYVQKIQSEYSAVANEKKEQAGA